MLEKERQYYDEKLSEWTGIYEGKFVLVKGHELIGVYDDPDAALAEGARQFGMTSFLVRQVVPVQQEVSVPALTLGILRVDTSRPAHR